MLAVMGSGPFAGRECELKRPNTRVAFFRMRGDTSTETWTYAEGADGLWHPETWPARIENPDPDRPAVQRDLGTPQVHRCNCDCCGYIDWDY